jgi:nuclease EXOG
LLDSLLQEITDIVMISLSPLSRQVMAGVVGAAGGILASNYIHDLQDVTYQEPPASSSIIKPSPSLSPRATKILAFGQPSTTLPSPIVYNNHVLEYDSARRVPRWVAEHLTKEQVKQEVAKRKGVNFSADPLVPMQFRSTNQDYWGSGWSRGHMAPAGDNKHCQHSMNDTFYLTNIVPQDMDNNGGYWNRLEIWVRGLTEQYQDVWVVSGPLWLPQENVDTMKL